MRSRRTALRTRGAATARSCTGESCRIGALEVLFRLRPTSHRSKYRRFHSRPKDERRWRGLQRHRLGRAPPQHQAQVAHLHPYGAAGAREDCAGVEYRVEEIIDKEDIEDL